jgi:hypothetical protein
LGLAASNKVTLLGPAGLVTLMATLKSPLTFNNLMSRGITALGLGVTAYLGVFWLCYLLRPIDALIAIRNCFGFLAAAGAEPEFWQRNFSLFFYAYDYDVVVYAWLVAMTCLAFGLVRSRHWLSRSGALWVGILLVAAMLVVGLIKRGAGTTYFEVATIATGLTAIAFAVGFGPRPNLLLGAPVVAIALWFAGTDFNREHNWHVVSKSTDLVNRAWQIHDFIETLSGPNGEVLIVGPVMWHGIEDLIALGLGDAAIQKASPFHPVRIVSSPVAAKDGDVIVEAKRLEVGEKAPEVPPSCRSWLVAYDEQTAVTVCPAQSLPASVSR